MMNESHDTSVMHNSVITNTAKLTKSEPKEKNLLSKKRE